MSTRDEDELWRSIVDNYGDRPVLDEEPGPENTSPPSPRPSAAPGASPSRSPLVPGPEPDVARPESTPEPDDAFVPFTEASVSPEDDTSDRDVAGSHEDGDTAPEHRFVPPTPPMPEMDRWRWAAWIAVLGTPTLFVLAALVGIRLNGLVAAGLALCFIAGFAWLVMKMPRDPGDPWDDGARV